MNGIEPHTDVSAQRRSLLAGAVIATYIASGLILAWATQTSFVGVRLTPEVAAIAWAKPVALLFGVTGIATALFVPGIPWVHLLARGRRLRSAAVFHRAFAINLIQTTAMLAIWKAIAGAVPGRGVFLAWQAFVFIAGAMAVRTFAPSRAPSPYDSRLLRLSIVVLLLVLPTLFWGKVFIEDASGDGTEAFEFSRSLDTHQLPNWDLENGHYGFYPQFMLFSYPTQLSFIAVGTTEAAQRLPVFLYALGITLVLGELVRRRPRRLSATELILLTGAVVFFFVYHSGRSTYELVTDLAEPTGVDTFFAFLLASSTYALVTGRRAWWATFAVMGCMASPAGLPFALLQLLAQWLAQRGWMSPAAGRRALGTLVTFGIPWLGYQAFVALYSKRFPMGNTKWELASMVERYPMVLSFGAAADVTSGLALAVAFLPTIGFAFLVRRDRIMRLLGFPLLGYLALLIVFGRRHPHYLIPISLAPTAMLLRGLAARDSGQVIQRTGHLLYGGVLAVMLVLAFPRHRTPHTTYRSMGQQTLMLFESYPAAVEGAKRVLELRPDLFLHLPDGKPFRPDPVTEGSDASLPVGLSHHLWVRYSDTVRNSSRPYRQVIAESRLAPDTLAGYARRDLPGGVVLFCQRESIFCSRTAN